MLCTTVHKTIRHGRRVMRHTDNDGILLAFGIMALVIVMIHITLLPEHIKNAKRGYKKIRAYWSGQL